jgi:adenylate cyclase
MKRCPQCNRVEPDEALKFCRVDGAPLVARAALDLESTTISLPVSKPIDLGATGRLIDTPSIAVLPFVNMSADSDNEFFCDGLAEELLNALAKIDKLKVAARTSAFSFKGKDANISEIGNALNVRTILEGSVRKSGNRLRITAQLVNAADGYHLWSERYDREMKDIFDVQDEITLAVVAELKVTLLGEVATSEPPTSHTGAYELYLKGRALLYQRGPSIGKAIECFNQAVALDPEYAQAWAGLADGYTTSAYSGYYRGPEAMPQALAAARRSLELDPDLAEAHNAFACATLLYDLDYQLAEKEFLKALELNPNYPQAVAWYGLFLLQWVSERSQEARAQMFRLVEVDPLSAYAHVIFAFSDVSSGHLSEALEHARQGVEFDPKSYLALWCLAVCLQCLGQFEEALAVTERALAISGRHSWGLTTLAAIYVAWDKPDKARAVHRELELRSTTEYVHPAMLTAAASVLGDADRAVAYAKQAVDEKDPLFVLLARSWPDYANVSADSRFREIVSRLNLPRWN